MLTIFSKNKYFDAVHDITVSLKIMGKLFAVYEIQDKRQRIANGHVSMVLERYGRRWMVRPLDLYTMEGGNP